MIDFESADRRLRRARRHIDEFRAIEAEFFRQSPLDFKIYVTPRGGAITYRLMHRVPHDAGDCFDDAIGNMREALEHALFAFAAPCGLHSRKELKALQFPTAETKDDFEGILPKMTKGLPDPVRAALRFIEPWGRDSNSDRGRSQNLWTLNVLAAHKRHRVLTPLGGSAAAEMFVLPSGTTILLGPTIEFPVPEGENFVFAWEGPTPEYRPIPALGLKDYSWLLGKTASEVLQILLSETDLAIRQLKGVAEELFK